MFIFVYVDDPEEDVTEQILLGESKYFAAVEDPDDDNSILIKEVPTGSNGEPVELEGLLAGAFGDDPVDVLSGGKPGVYWERKWAHINSNGSISGGDLPSGMIRLVGRYWEEDNDYRVKLNASSGSRSGELEVEVVRPDRLGNQFRYARDVFDRVVDVDSLIIVNAGKYGIPPQFIKAHISVEAAPKDFGGDVGRGFAPSYLYEPYTVQFWNLRDLLGRYFIDNSSQSQMSDVPTHQHVLFRDYYKEVKTVWDIVKSNSQLVDDKAINTYGKRGPDRKMDFNLYTTIQAINDQKFDELLNDVQNSNLELTNIQIADSTNRIMADFLRDEWKGGLKNHIAQTRTASSYELLQMLYVTAREKINYDIDELPEYMNTNNFFVESIIYQRNELNEFLSDVGDSDYKWTVGYEEAFRSSIFDVWNPSPGYPDNILKRVKDYLPVE